MQLQAWRCSGLVMDALVTEDGEQTEVMNPVFRSCTCSGSRVEGLALTLCGRRGNDFDCHIP